MDIMVLYETARQQAILEIIAETCILIELARDCWQRHQDHQKLFHGILKNYSWLRYLQGLILIAMLDRNRLIIPGHDRLRRLFREMWLSLL